MNVDLPPGSAGYVYIPALPVLACASVAMAPQGVRAAHALPVDHIRTMFAGFTALVGLRMAGVLAF